jgi:hypothetical protein
MKPKLMEQSEHKFMAEFTPAPFINKRCGCKFADADRQAGLMDAIIYVAPSELP